ncbi:MAG: type II toxin-antitoxin system VapC family toxin [Pseudanabaena sp. M158S2SP1A06QC]|nr:type II toxin-antitoxin system VapC family toxin [Pseudanabaena sp. M158S2SP1A06QC]
MSAVLLDTHTIIWYFLDFRRLSANAFEAIESARQINIASISIVEIIYLQEKGKLASEALPRLNQIFANDPNWNLIPLDFEIAKAIANIPRETVPEMPDRIIAATALYLNIPLVTKDSKIQAANIQTIW